MENNKKLKKNVLTQPCRDYKQIMVLAYYIKVFAVMPKGMILCRQCNINYQGKFTKLYFDGQISMTSSHHPAIAQVPPSTSPTPKNPVKQVWLVSGARSDNVVGEALAMTNRAGRTSSKRDAIPLRHSCCQYTLLTSLPRCWLHNKLCSS